MALSPSPKCKIPGFLLLILAFGEWTESTSPVTTPSPCLSKPCQHGALCKEVPTDYLCQCRSSVTAPSDGRCEESNELCYPVSCHENAACRPVAANSSELLCRCQPGASGVSCDELVRQCAGIFCGRGEGEGAACVPSPCRSGASCRGRADGYACFCVPGYQGRHCEIEVNECASQPCQNGATCVNMIGRYVCVCGPGYTGALCEEDINECDWSPCQNGGVCENRRGGYACHCLKQSQDGLLYGGENCTEALLGCRGHGCQNGGGCSPFLRDGRQGYSCSCPGGFAGPRCETPTAFSFETSGRLELRAPPADRDAALSVALSFRTVLDNVRMFRRGGAEALLGLELAGGRLRLTLRWGDGGGPTQALALPHNVSDGEWHSAAATLGDGLLRLQLLDARCMERCEEALRAESPETPEPTFRSTVFGGDSERGEDPGYFVGCLRDVRVDSRLVAPENWPPGSAVNVTPGCSHRDRCADVPCQNRGRCVNLWQSYQCECRRPYEGLNCSEEYITGRFGQDDSPSYAVFRVDDDPGESVTVSAFVRTRKRAGLLWALSNGTGPYLRAWLEDGRVRVRAGDQEAGLRGEQLVSDGSFHLVSVRVERGQASLERPGRGRGAATAGGGLRVRPGDLVHVGGLADRRALAPYGGHFGGCVQDLRLNSGRMQFFPIGAPVSGYSLQRLVAVAQGCASEDYCSKNPCRNGGTCYSIWDDFTCTCPPNTAGRRCEEVQWCELRPCPPATACQPLPQGFECISNATFYDDGSVLSYRSNGKISRNLTSISFSVRTRKADGVILHAEKGREFVTVSVRDSHLVLELLSGDGSLPLTLKSRGPISDGRWHSAELSVTSPRSQTSGWTVRVDQEEKTSASAVPAGNLNFLKEGADVLLGGRGPGAAGGLAGCLSTAAVGGLALPYHGESEVSLPRPQEERFVRTSRGPAPTGCREPAACSPDPCRNGGFCRDLPGLSSFSCACPPGWAGPLCESAGACASGPCVHGNCSLLRAAAAPYECVCEPGYGGATCEDELDACRGHGCANGGTCLPATGRYSCLCPENYTGPHCTVELEEVPWYIIKHIRPKLPVSICGDEQKNYTCFNGGNCSETSLMCDCMSGFTGHRCELELDECQSNPCLNGGYCRNLVDRFQCVCDMSFAGEVCQVDVSDIYFYVSMLLWQNLFQLLSYLILRLDDEPDVDWGGAEE